MAILEEETYKEFGYYSTDLSPHSSKKIIVKCDICGEIRENRKCQYRSLCYSCVRQLAKGPRNPNWRGGKTERVCKFCGKTFFTTSNIIKRGYGFYCSTSCAAKSRTGEKANNWQGGDVTHMCKTCGRKFEVSKVYIKTGRGFYCSAECAGKAHRGKNAANWRGGKITRICEMCGKSFKTRPSEIKKGRGRFCSHSCSIKAVRHNARPKKTHPERIFEDICTKYNVLFRFVGDGSLWLGNANPDFVHKTRKVVVEIFGDYWHSPLLNRNVTGTRTVEGRRKQLKNEGYKLIVLWESDLKRSDAESFVLSTLAKNRINV